MTTRSAAPPVGFDVIADMICNVHQGACPVSASASVVGAVAAASHKVKLLFHDEGGGGDGDDGDRGNVMEGRKRRERMKGGSATMTASSNVDIDVTGCRGRDK
jgi:hypothetical protein